ncbi:MAG TPA: tRNA epoxyqueuosine(34) reductase QueG, partial [Anaerolineales bacterium]|nr:tRNA epoxyqueuosine(34) reductase QueG [Anaerolineales bacterium]
PHLDVFEGWVDEGLHGQMGYLAAERARRRRANPLEILPECRSVLVLGAYHDPPVVSPPPDDGKPRARLAAYAWGDDYHQVLKPRLEAIISFIEEEAGWRVPARWYTDTGPILEREFGQRAGLGWIGKNTCLINPHRGSYFLLAEILLGIELEPDAPVTLDHCGSCRRCIEACPTGCILPDRTIDARLCISYLTIELRGEIPLELRAQMGNWVFGCDICQEVCPWNIRFAQKEGNPEFRPRTAGREQELLPEIRLDQAGFAEKFRGSPVRRAGRDGYLRNVAVALGNSGNQAAVPDLVGALREDPSPLVRGHAAWALGQLGSQEAALGLRQAQGTETDVSVLEEIERSLGIFLESDPPAPGNSPD